MTPDAFRKLALELPRASEEQHMGHPDFRVGGKIFATLGYPSKEFATVLLNREEQFKLVQEAPDTFAPVKGGWGLKGSTNVRLPAADRELVRRALRLAWQHKAPKRLAAPPSAGPPGGPRQRHG